MLDMFRRPGLFSVSHGICYKRSAKRHVLLFSGDKFYSDDQSYNKIFGFVGGCIFLDKQFFRLTPALSYIDQTYLSGVISDRVKNFAVFKNSRDVEFHYSTFEQQNFVIAISPIGPSFGSVKDPSQLSVHYIKRRNRIQHGVGNCVQNLQRRGIADIFVDPCDDSESAAEGAVLSAFVYDELKSSNRQVVRPQFTCFTEHLDHSCSPDDKKSILSAWNRGVQMATAQNLARKWMEMPANLLTPTEFASQVCGALADLPVKVHVRDTDWCRAQKLNGLLSVGAGSHHKEVFLELIYEGNPSKPSDHIALVGKGVTFDAGGICLKAATGMEDMRADMGGAAVVVSTIFGLSNLHVPINVRGYIPLCENMPGGGAMRPGDVIRMASGLTVQVNNTDAEGRLILADALHMACHHPDLVTPPSLVIDVATLTGAISVALGDEFIGVFQNDKSRRSRMSSLWKRPETDTELVVDPSVVVDDEDESDELEVSAQPEAIPIAKKINVTEIRDQTLLDCLRSCAVARGDRIWGLPLLYKSAIREQAHLSDLVNVLGGPYAKKGGSGVAASFLCAFVPKHIPWIHMDIAGVMKPSPRESHIRKGMTGRPTRTLIEFLDTLSRW